MYWIMRGRLSEARAWIERALALGPAGDDLHRRLLSSLATIASLQGDHEVAVEAADEAADLASALGGATDRIEQLRERGSPRAEGRLGVGGARVRGAVRARDRRRQRGADLRVAVEPGDDREQDGAHDRAEELLRENLTFVRSRGQSRCEATTLAMLAETAIHRDRGDAVSEPARVAAVRSSRSAMTRC